MAACLLHPFEKCMGIELMENLYKTSLRLKEKYQEEIRQLEGNQLNFNQLWHRPEALGTYLQSRLEEFDRQAGDFKEEAIEEKTGKDEA